ncbi:MAG TPA: CD225/dispanin family protein [Streptosporangiaceae bacterium]|nr:CD225/dispanin family protein [Streptosporangiaceae bacterium]
MPPPPPPGPYGVPPAPGYGQLPYGGNRPSTYRAWVITCCICGVLFSLIIGLPCGLVALANSRRVQSSWQVGDWQRAAKASRRALTWAIVSTVFDALGLILVITLFAHGHSSTT